MIKRVIIAWCRYYNNYEEAKVFIDFVYLIYEGKTKVSSIRAELAVRTPLGKDTQKKMGFLFWQFHFYHRKY